MAELTVEAAIARARAALGIARAARAQVWPVQRLDLPGDRYYLVIFETDPPLLGVAAIGTVAGELRAAAELEAGPGPLLLSAQQARARAALPADAVAELVWQPCRASLSPLYPLWRIRSAAETRYIDQQGTLWTALEPGAEREV